MMNYLIIQELGISNKLEKYMSFSLLNELVFTVSFQFLNSPLDSLVKNLGIVYFKYLGQECDNDVLKLLDQKGLYPNEYVFSFGKFKKKIPW